MNRNKYIHVRVNDEELSELNQNSEKKGFKTLSAYVRNTIINEGKKLLQEKIISLKDEISEEKNTVIFREKTKQLIQLINLFFS